MPPYLLECIQCLQYSLSVYLKKMVLLLFYMNTHTIYTEVCLPVTVAWMAWLTMVVGEFIWHLYSPAWIFSRKAAFFASVMLLHSVMVSLKCFTGLRLFSSVLYHEAVMLLQQWDSLTIVQLIFRTSVTQALHDVFLDTMIVSIQTGSDSNTHNQTKSTNTPSIS